MAATFDIPATPTGGSVAAPTPTDEVLREITRGGLTGLVVGILLAGVGGRVVMRLAALLAPAADGRLTENGNVVGAITLEGTAALIVFIGLFFGAVVGSLWVTIRPWLPRTALARALVAIPIAVALGTAAIVDDRNRDFDLVGRDPVIIASLVVLVAAFGPALVLVERVMDHLPHARSGDRGLIAVYATVTVIGALLTAFAVVPTFLGSDLAIAGWALVVVGAATLGSWWLRIMRSRLPGPRLTLVARLALAVATVAGLRVAWVEVAGALTF